jgi:hypothetical protein
MDYVELRDSVKDGDLVLFKGRHIVSRIIAWVTGSKYTHSGIVAWWGERVMLLEATVGGVKARLMSTAVGEYSGKADLYICLSDKLDRTLLLNTARRELGKAYAYWSLVRAARRFIAKVREPDPKKPPEAFHCTQYVSSVYREAGVDLAENHADVFTTPADLSKSPHLQFHCILK